jgi:hypothetical protein
MKSFERFIWFILLIMVICAVATVFIISTASASVISFGPNYNYSEVVLPNNSFVRQGENISQGYYYDLNGIYGFSGKIAHWKHPDDAGYETPDSVITLNGASHYMTFIDPTTFPIGQWFQWDGVTCDSDTGWCKSGFGHGNNYVFSVVPKEPTWTTVNKVVTRYKNITYASEDGNTSTIQVTVQETVQVQETVAEVLVSNVTTLIVPTPQPTMMTIPSTPPQTLLLPNSDHTPVPTTIEVVTPKSAGFEWIGLLALLVAVIVCRRK